ncbi:hypothetical protein [Alkalimarinus sediminis]|uniref:Outer membrane protein beta-barrel domain-containing protein n=1 Tax=Alkalimarinus sediminis TaxID=1632866 RepID=A0A9E8HK62_9ALTE|nr:hypothetical protein [Alkalimarinus sediminis]UZW75647.1 hypothetical protein NNL22_03365 [Alkalimarinus sediminis]
MTNQLYATLSATLLTLIGFTSLLSSDIQADPIRYQEVTTSDKPTSDDWIYLSVILGNLDTQAQAVVTDPDTGEQAYADVPSMPFGGIQAQIPIAKQWFEYGFETGANISWKNDSFVFVATNNQAVIALKNQLFLMEVHGGVFAAIAPSSRFRVYAGAGPLIAFGHIDNNDDEPTNLPATQNVNVSIDLGKSENDISLGVYGRAGVEYFTRSGFSFGAGVRRAKYDMDFGSVAGDIAFNDNLYFISLGQRFKIY